VTNIQFYFSNLNYNQQQWKSSTTVSMRSCSMRDRLQHLASEPGMNWWRISPSNNIREQVKDSVHLLEQVGYMETEESFGKVKLSILLERKFGDKFIVVP
jgi:hypothetical protein